MCEVSDLVPGSGQVDNVVFLLFFLSCLLSFLSFTFSSFSRGLENISDMYQT